MMMNTSTGGMRAMVYIVRHGERIDNVDWSRQRKESMTRPLLAEDANKLTIQVNGVNGVELLVLCTCVLLCTV